MFLKAIDGTLSGAANAQDSPKEGEIPETCCYGPMQYIDPSCASPGKAALAPI